MIPTYFSIWTLMRWNRRLAIYFDGTRITVRTSEFTFANVNVNQATFFAIKRESWISVMSWLWSSYGDALLKATRAMCLINRSHKPLANLTFSTWIDRIVLTNHNKEPSMLTRFWRGSNRQVKTLAVQPRLHEFAWWIEQYTKDQLGHRLSTEDSNWSAGYHR